FHDETMQRFSKKNEPVNIKVKLVRHQLNEAIPTISEFIQFIHNLNQKIVINIEIKSGTETGISTLIKALKKANFKKYVKFIFSSFKPEIIRQLIQEQPGQIGVLIKNITAFREIKINKKELKEVDFIIINYRNIRKKDLVQFIKMKKSIGIYFQSKTDFEKKRISAIRSYQAKLIFTEG
ncbi:MAG: glycerophosphodiester phosphodiesterase family protein, partial [Candidatus Margulisiibacteriota bacterium]